MKTIGYKVGCILPLCLLVCLPLQVSAEEKPNIVLVFMDNFGWGEPGFNGGGIFRGAAIPELDKSFIEALELFSKYNCIFTKMNITYEPN